MNPFDKVLDSSIWPNFDNLSAHNKKDGFARVGIILDIKDDEKDGTLKYVVEVMNQNDTILMWCTVMTSLGGVYNFEDKSLHGYTAPNSDDDARSFKSKAGDFVLVIPLNGSTREGVILGGLSHPARVSELKAADGPSYIKEINGVETRISPEGEYTLTFKGLPTNIADLDALASDPIAPPEYNEEIQGSFLKFDKTGSITLSDASTEMPQSMLMDKSAGTFAVTSGEIVLFMDKASKATSLKTVTFSVDSEKSIEQKTGEYSVDATKSIKMKSPKIAIGTGGVELLDQLIKAIDALGKVAPISPVGNCTPLMATPDWPAVEQIKAKIESIKGSL